jgi:hypothetical protein
MNNLVPHRVREMESDSRGIKEGWYAANTSGHICSGRFSNQEDCRTHITETSVDNDARPLKAAFNH